MENLELVEGQKIDKRTVQRRYHSKKCTWSRGRAYSMYGICSLCDDISTGVVSVENANHAGLELHDKFNANKVYCQKTVTHFARCTKYTNPKCGCGKLVWKQNTKTEYGVLY